MDGLLIIDKPEGMTSHDVVDRVRRILKTKRVGHTGTLDPFATGVLVMLVGKATRLAQFLDKDEKEYEAVIQFGFETDTGDRTGMQNAECRMQNDGVAEKLSTVDWGIILNRFRGEIDQLPPMYSAKKVDGKKLYEHARKGVAVERKTVKVRISELEVVAPSYSDDLGLGTWNVGLRVVCSAGTYIRTLAEDIGRTVGTGAHLQELRRTRAGKFGIPQAVTIEELEAEEEPVKRLLPINNAVGHLPEFILSDERIERTRNGLSTRVESGRFQDGENIRMILDSGELIAIGVYRESEISIRPKVVLS